MTTLRLYDTAAREKRVFTPREPDRITMYLCGPTVYGRAHIGNARPAVVFDVLARLLRHLYPNHRLDYARNITDVDDKIIAAAQAEGVDPQIITDRYERHYLHDIAALGVEAPPIQPRATQHVPDMIAMIVRLVELGHAYAGQGHVLFSVASDPDYGSLSRRDAEALRAGARVEVAPYKRDAGDFVLWKPSAPEIIGWDSPWGRGRPGWHIECSAMIERHLGNTIDIHAGGLDLIFPHHENEAAQSRSAHDGEPLANIWMHNGFVNMGGGDKMSKSLGNVATISELVDQHRVETLRFALLTAHYRQPLEWTEELLKDSKTRLDRLHRAATPTNGWTPVEQSGELIEALSDDLNLPAALGVLSKLARSGQRDELIEGAKLLGLFRSGPADWFKAGSYPTGSGTIYQQLGDHWSGRDEVAFSLSDISRMIAQRGEAKLKRDFAEADRIRTELSAAGILLEDTPTGTTWRRA